MGYSLKRHIGVGTCTSAVRLFTLLLLDRLTLFCAYTFVSAYSVFALTLTKSSTIWSIATSFLFSDYDSTISNDLINYNETADFIFNELVKFYFIFKN